MSKRLKRSAPTETNLRSVSKKQTQEKPSRVSGEIRYYLIKSEPESRIENGQEMKFSIDDLASCPNQTQCWDGVRNYQARNLLREMRIGDMCLFYHSSCKMPGVVGLAKVVTEPYPDHTQFDKSNVYYDARSDKTDPKWWMVDVKFVCKFSNPDMLTLNKLRGYDKLKDMALFHTARLSVQPVTASEYDFIVSIGTVAN